MSKYLSPLETCGVFFVFCSGRSDSQNEDLVRQLMNNVGFMVIKQFMLLFFFFARPDSQVDQSESNDYCESIPLTYFQCPRNYSEEVQSHYPLRFACQTCPQLLVLTSGGQNNRNNSRKYISDFAYSLIQAETNDCPQLLWCFQVNGNQLLQPSNREFHWAR